MRNLASLFIALLTTGCVIGNSYKFDYKPASMPNVGSGATVVLMEPSDQRSYVVKGEESKSFVGEMRNGYGMPFNVTTEGEKPFSQVVEEIAARDLTAAGFRVVRGGPGAADQIPSVLRTNNALRGVQLVIREFNANTFTNIDLEWDIDASAYDENGLVVKTNNVKGKTSLEGSMMNPVKASKKKVPEFLYKTIHDLLSEISSALTGS